MTDQQQHPITPPRELVRQWRSEPEYATPGRVTLHTISEQRLFQLLTRSAQWGYDQRGEVDEAKLQKARDEELDACCEWLDRIAYRQSLHIRGSHLRDARRPKPPNLKDLALSELETILNKLHRANGSILTASAIRRALEALPDD